MDNEKKHRNGDNSMFPWHAALIFAVCIFLICGLFFLVRYEDAYDTDTRGGWLSPGFGVAASHVIFAIVFSLSAIVLKVIFKKRVYLRVLLLTALLLPIILYNVSYHTLKKGGSFHFLVDKGGIFHFITIADWNLDGMNDELHHRTYDERVYLSRCTGHYEDTVIENIDVVATGTGKGLDGTYCSYDWEDKLIKLNMNKSGVEYKEIRIKVTFHSSTDAEKVLFRIDKKVIPASKGDKVATLTFDAAACAEFQNSSEKEYVRIPIEYLLDYLT